MEESIGTALKGFTDASPVLGGVIILLLAAIVWQSRFYGGIIKEMKEDYKSEREAHDKTRAEQREDYRNMAHVTKSVEGLQDSVKEMQTTIREVLRKNA